jgi:lipopolysaccharide transport system permease protein
MATLTPTRVSGVLHVLNPLTLADNLWRNRDLIRQFTRREIQGRYRGSFLGLFWSFINPLALLLIYTFVFGVIFKSRWPQSTNNTLGAFAVTLFCGLTAFNIFSETVNRAPGLIVGVPNYVKKVIFPLEILPVSTLGASLFHAGVSLLILLAASVVINGTLHWTVVLLPLVAVPLVFLTLGVAWFLASLGVFIRDIGYAIGLVVQVLFFLTPIFYPLDAVPPAFRPLILVNPLAPVAENFRRVIMWGDLPSWRGLALWILITGAAMVLGYAWFMKTKKAFADVI